MDVAKSKGFRSGENPVTEIRDAQVLPKVKAKPVHHHTMPWRDVPEFVSGIVERKAMAALALRFTILTAARTSEVLGATWEEIGFQSRLWTVPANRMKSGIDHRVPLTDEMLAIIEPLEAMDSRYVFEGQKRHKPLSNMSMLMLLRRIGVDGVTVHGFRSSFRDWAAKAADAPRELAETVLAHQVGNEVERAYARSDLLERRRRLMERWNGFVSGGEGKLVRFG